MTGISGIEFVAWALPLSALSIVIGVYILCRFEKQIGKFGEKHIPKKKKNKWVILNLRLKLVTVFNLLFIAWNKTQKNSNQIKNKTN